MGQLGSRIQSLSPGDPPLPPGGRRALSKGRGPTSMLAFLLDTDHVTLYEYAHPLVMHRVAHQPPRTVGISDVTLEESLRGRLAALAQARNGTTRIMRYAQLRGTVR